MTRLQAVGTTLWMAPELLRRGSYGTPCDVYSFGIVMWELLALQLPWASLNSVDEIASYVLAGLVRGSFCTLFYW